MVVLPGPDYPQRLRQTGSGALSDEAHHVAALPLGAAAAWSSESYVDSAAFCGCRCFVIAGLPASTAQGPSQLWLP